MADTINSIIGGVRSYLRFPPESLISDGVIVERIFDKLAYYINQLNLTAENWHLEQWLMDVDPSEEVYSVNQVDWGVPMLIETIDESDPQHQRREIEICRMQDLDRFYDGPSTVLNSPVGYPWSAQAMAFYRESGQDKVRVVPTPSVSASYRVWYEPAGISVSALTDVVPFLSNFSNLLKVDTAIVCLPDTEMDDVKYKRVQSVLTLDLERFTQQFEMFKQNLFQEQTGKRRGWGDDYDNYGEVGY